MLDVLKVDKPIKQSCFSAQQIEALYRLYRKFVGTQLQPGINAEQTLAQLFPENVNVRRKYEYLRVNPPNRTGFESAPALTQHEAAWVMGQVTPTPFIRFLRTEGVIQDFQMSFKPPLDHQGPLTVKNMQDVLQRFWYWLRQDQRRSINVIGVVNDLISTEQMLNEFKQRFYDYRFHVAVLGEQGHWTAVLVQRASKPTEPHIFEFYDPRATRLDFRNHASGLAQQVRALYDLTRTLTATEHRKLDLVTKSLDRNKRGFRHESNRQECGMYVLQYLQFRVVLGHTFEHFVAQKITHHSCHDLRPMFFDLNQQMALEMRQKRLVETSRIKYGDYDVRLAVIQFARYLDYLISITSSPQSQSLLQRDSQQLLSSATQPGDYIHLNVQGLSVQKNLLQVLPPQFTTYAGTDVWFTTVQEIVTDPLTVYLRKIKSTHRRRGRTQSNARRTVTSRMFQELTGWTSQLGVPPQQGQVLDQFMGQLIDQVYLPVLQFDPDNASRFSIGMGPEAFLAETMQRQKSVSWGVHFLREVRHFVLNTLHRHTTSELNNPKFAPAVTVVRPTTPDNIQEIRQTVSRCDQVMQRAFELLQTTFQQQAMTGTYTSPKAAPVTTGFNFLAQQAGPSSMQSAQLLTTITARIFADLQAGTLGRDPPKPWQYPVNVPSYNNAHPQHPITNARYSVTTEEMKELLHRPDFQRVYALEVLALANWLANYNHANTNLSVEPYVSLTERTRRGLTSVLQMYEAVGPFSQERQILCTLLNYVYKTVQLASPVAANLTTLLAYVGQIHQQCVAANNIDDKTPFFQRVFQEYKRLMEGQ